MEIEDKIKNALEIVKKDWERLPNILKYCFIGGALNLLAAYLMRSAANSFFIPLYAFTISTTMQKVSFSLFVMLVILMPILYMIVVRLKICYYRWRYPIEHLGKDFFFATLGHAIHLIDIKNSQIRWIENPRTAFDLGYYPSAWTEAKQFKSFYETIQLNSRSIDLSKFQIKPGIRTQRIPSEQ